ncbi:P2X purinoceptor 3-like, partial [Mobula birostris]|uniref:P2X purinoceptor 3-like n=1 Tax=Mobula birostris TaxID=1983395 RepID=UPI003B27E860
LLSHLPAGGHRGRGSAGLQLPRQKGGCNCIKILWNCNLDRSADLCIPHYTFQRLDRISQNNNVSQGYNFRYARFYRDGNGTEYRTLIKSYGIRIDILVLGQAAKFDIIPTLINVVAAFTSIGLGAVVCDLILLNFMKGAERYKARKFEEVPNSGHEHSVRRPMSHQTAMQLTAPLPQPRPLRGHLQIVDGPLSSPPAGSRSWGDGDVRV